MILKIQLEWIEDNPFQTRLAYDPAAIRELAESIAELRETRSETMGLIQVPPARGVDEAGNWELGAEHWGLGRWGEVRARLEAGAIRIQLAAGHSRLRAFQMLAEEDPAAWGEMPLDLADLDDQAMADIAWSENQKRRDLTAIEEARAIESALERFGWTQQELGRRWGLSQSAVANKLRLLRLPDVVQEMVANRRLTERHARELLPLVQTAGRPDRAAALANRAVNKHLSAEDLARDVKQQVQEATRRVDEGLVDFDEWGPEDSLPAGCVPICRECEHFVARKRSCRRPEAYHEKFKAYADRNLALAAEETGLPVLPNGILKTIPPAALARARARGCPNLGVVRQAWTADTAVQVEGRANVYFACREGKYDCHCRQLADEETAHDADAGEDEARMAALRRFQDRQHERAREIRADTQRVVKGRFKAALRSADEEALRLFIALVKSIRPGFRVAGPEGLAQMLAELTIMGGSAGDWWPGREGQARARRAELFHRLGMAGQPLVEVEAHIQTMRDELTEANLAGWSRRWTHRMEAARDRAREILNAYQNHREHARLTAALAAAEAAIEEWISGEIQEGEGDGE